MPPTGSISGSSNWVWGC